MIVMLLRAGSYKMTAPGAEGIVPLVSNGPLTWWHFKLFGRYSARISSLGVLLEDPFAECNVMVSPAFQNYFRTHKPRFLAAWGTNDPFFLPRGAEAFKRDIPGAMVHFFDTGHFA